MLVTLRGQGLKRKQASSHQTPPLPPLSCLIFVWNIANTCTNPCKTNINQDNNQGSDLEIFIWKALAASHPPSPLSSHKYPLMISQIPTHAFRTDVTEYFSGIHCRFEDSCLWTFWRKGLASTTHRN